MAESASGGTRRLSLLVGALNALFVVFVPVAALVFVTSAVWLIENDPTLPWLTSLRTALDFWFIGHGVALDVSAQTLVGIDSPAFSFSFAPIGMLLVVVMFGRRTAKKLRGSNELWPGWLGATLVYGTASIIMLPLASSPAVAPNANEAVLFPVALFGISTIGFGLFGSWLDSKLETQPSERLALLDWLAARRERANWFFASISAPAFKAGTAVVVGLIGISAVMLAASLTLNWISVTRLFEGLQVSFIGGIALTIAQLLILPNLVFYGASWLTGAGFAIGAGSSISPLGTQVGPIPALPILGGLPIGTNIPALAVIVIPVALALFATVMIKNHTKELRFHFASPISAAFSLGVGVGFVAAVEAALLALLTSGSLGPDRLQEVGVNPLMLAAVVFIEVAPVSVLAAFYSARPDKAAPIPDYLKR